jgi:hypothetical protein
MKSHISLHSTGNSLNTGTRNKDDPRPIVIYEEPIYSQIYFLAYLIIPIRDIFSKAIE